MAPALQQMTQLTALDLSCNYLGEESAWTALVPALSALTRLKSLEMGGQQPQMGRAGLLALAPALQGMTQLESNGRGWELRRMAMAVQASGGAPLEGGDDRMLGLW